MASHSSFNLRNHAVNLDRRAVQIILPSVSKGHASTALSGCPASEFDILYPIPLHVRPIAARKPTGKRKIGWRLEAGG
jgi:hypothetical protein